MLYLKLFHGRTDPAQNMDDWGFDGPVFGPYDFIHTTYACHVKMGRDNGDLDELRIVGDMIFYDGKYYGDWSVYEKPEKSLIEAFDSNKAEPPETKKQDIEITVYILGGVCQDVKTNMPDGTWDYTVVDYDNKPDQAEPFDKELDNEQD